MSTIDNDDEDLSCRTRLLSDEPAQDDAFGSHEDVAEAIATLIRTEEGGKAISLRGDWGSGKSTIVNLVDADLRESETAVFVYDAWAHQGDPLRRSFLESLIDHARGNEWVTGDTQDKWERKKKELAGTIRESRTVETPRLTPAGKVMAISTLSVPAGLGLLSLAAAARTAPALLTLGFVLTFLPVVAAISLVATAKAPSWLPFLEEPEDGDQSLRFLYEEAEKEIQSQVTESPEPTSIEFQDAFTDLLQDILEEQDRRILIVIDNLDRLEAEEAVRLWTVMRTFFEMGATGESWFERFWLLVPIGHLPIGLLSGESARPNRGGNREEKVRKPHLEKMFQVDFQVPPPVLSDWRDYFEDQLREALPDHDGDDFYDVYRLFNRMELDNKRTPTPRQIKLFINELGAYHRIWEDEIPLVYQAAYVLLCRNGGLETDQIARSGIRDRLHTELFSGDPRPLLAALHFGVPREKALQLILKPRIESAFQEGDVKTLTESADIPGFWDVALQALEENVREWRQNTPVALAHAGHVISELEEETGYVQTDRHREVLHQRIKQVTDWSALTGRAGEGIVELIRHMDQDEKAKVTGDLIQAISDSVPSDIPDDEQQDPSWPAWIEGAAALMDYAREEGIAGEGEAPDRFQLELKPRLYIHFVKMLQQEGFLDRADKVFTYGGKEEDLGEHLATVLQSMSKDPGFGRVVCHIIGDFPDIHLDTVTDTRKVLQTDNNLSSDQVRCLHQILLFSAFVLGNDQAEEALRNLAGGHSFHHLLRCEADSAKAEVALPILLMNPDLTLDSNPWNASNGKQRLDEIRDEPGSDDEVPTRIGERSVEYGVFDRLLEAPRENQALDALVSEVARAVLERPELTKAVPTSSLVTAYDMAGSSLDVDTGKTRIQEIINREDFPTVLEEEGLSDSVVSVINRGFESGASFTSDNLELLADHVSSLTGDEILEDLKTGCETLELAITLDDNLAEGGIEFSLGTPHQEAFTDHAKLMLRGEIEADCLSGKWDQVRTVMSGGSFITLMRNIRDRMLSNPGDGITRVLDVYGSDLISSGVLSESGDKADEIVRILFDEALDRRNNSELSWVLEVVRQEEVIESCNTTSREAFKGSLEGLLEEGIEEDETEELLQQMLDGLE